MPKIPIYDTQVSPEASLPGQNPDRVDASASSFGFGNGLINAGSGLEHLGEALDTAEQQQEVSDVRAKMATLRGNLTAGFEVAASKSAPGDPAFTDKFMSGVTNQLADMGGTIQTKAGLRAFAQESAATTADFLAKSTEFTVHSAGAKAVADWQTTVNQNAGTLFNDPSQASSVFKSIDASMNDPAGPFANVPPDKKAALELQAKEQLAMAAARGVVRMNPDTAEKLYNKGNLPGQNYLTEAGNAQIVSYIQTAQNAERTKKALALAQQEHAETMAAEADGNAILKDIVRNPADPRITDQILNSRMKWSQKETMLNIAQHTGAGDGHDQNSYGAGFFQVYQDIHAGKITTPDQLYSRVGPQQDMRSTFDTTKAPGMVKPGNLDPWNRPVLHNPGGGYSTTSSISIGTSDGETLIPTVVNGQRLSNAAAIQHFKQTGENLGVFKTPAAADDYATKLHNAQASLYDQNGNPLPRSMGDLTVAGVDRLTGEIMGRRSPEGKNEADMKEGFVKAMRQQLSGTNELLHLRDPQGDAIAQSALVHFLGAYDQAKQEGKLPPSVLLDPKDPRSLWGGVMRYKRDPNTMMRDLMAQNPGADVGAATPSYKSAGEVAAAYKAGTITRAQAADILTKNKWAQ